MNTNTIYFFRPCTWGATDWKTYLLSLPPCPMPANNVNKSSIAFIENIKATNLYIFYFTVWRQNTMSHLYRFKIKPSNKVSIVPFFAYWNFNSILNIIILFFSLLIYFKTYVSIWNETIFFINMKWWIKKNDCLPSISIYITIIIIIQSFVWRRRGKTTRPNSLSVFINVKWVNIWANERNIYYEQFSICEPHMHGMLYERET